MLEHASRYRNAGRHARCDTLPLATNPGTARRVLPFGTGDRIFAPNAVRVREGVDVIPRIAVPGAGPLVDDAAHSRGRVIDRSICAPRSTGATAASD